MSKDNIMSTKIHDEMIEEAVGWAKSLGYGVVEYNLGTNTGADAIFENRFGEKAILEIVTGASFRELFKKPRIREGFEEDEKWDMVPEILWAYCCWRSDRKRRETWNRGWHTKRTLQSSRSKDLCCTYSPLQRSDSCITCFNPRFESKCLCKS